MPFIAMFQADCFSHENRSPWLFFFLFFPHSSDSVSKKKPKKGIWQLTDASWQNRKDEATKYVIGQKRETRLRPLHSYMFSFPPFSHQEKLKCRCLPQMIFVYSESPTPLLPASLPLSQFLPSFPSFLSFPTSRLNRD